ncbi:hypothetical protein ACIRFH_02085 [Streptomyces sp. NPDC093586]|uniref:hypothetical protein n=1 Tax=Streptomyces sp. NPDC093586 TaxID=3366042 RepID=UPI00381C0265
MKRLAFAMPLSAALIFGLAGCIDATETGSASKAADSAPVETIDPNLPAKEKVAQTTLIKTVEESAGEHGGVFITVVMSPQQAGWDAEQVVKSAPMVPVKAIKKYYKGKQVDGVLVRIVGEITDEYGNSDPNGLIATWRMGSDFEKVNIDNLEYEQLWDLGGNVRVRL